MLIVLWWKINGSLKMASYQSIFIKTDEAEEVFISYLENLLGVKFTSSINGYGTGLLYYSLYEDFGIDVGIHELEGNRDLKFKEYAYKLTIIIKESHSKEINVARAEKAQRLYQRPCDTNRYGLMLVEDIQYKLAEYHPPT